MIHQQVTREEWREYDKAIHRWMQTLGVTGWQYETRWVDSIDSDFQLTAQTSYNWKARTAAFLLTKARQYDYADIALGWPTRIALHEVLHLMLSDYAETIHETKDSDCRAVVSAEHALIQRLVPVIAPQARRTAPNPSGDSTK